MPATVKERESEARFKMLEQLADYDDELMEQLLSDVQPPRDKIFADLAKELQDGLIVPVLLGSAENGNGILRLLKALRHEAPFVDRTARRLKLENAKSAGHVLKTLYSPHGGKLSIVRVLAGEFGEGTVVQGARSEERAAAAFSLLGQDAKKRAPAKAGETVALGRLEKIYSGETLSAEKAGGTQIKAPEPPEPVYGVAIGVKDRKDEVKLTGALARLMEEDPSLRLEHAKDTHQMVLWGQGEMHLRVALERLKRKYGVEADLQAAPAALQGDDQEGHRDPRPAQEAVGRSRPVRRRGARHQAAAARLGLPVRREDHRRRGAAPVHPLGRDRRVGLPAARAARRLPGGRRGGDADRRLLPLGRLLRHGLPPGRPHRHGRGHAQVQPGAARARSWRWRSPSPPTPRRASTA